MRNLSIFITLGLFLTACGRSPTLTLVPTSAPTSLPSPIPTATLTPTPIVDPNMPPGAMGKDDAGRYFTLENGTKYYFLPEVLGNKEFESRIKNGPINLTGYGESAYDAFPLNFNVYFVKNFDYAQYGKYLVHPPGPSDFVKDGTFIQSGSLASTITVDLFLNVTGFIPRTDRQKFNLFANPQRLQKWFTEVNAFVKDINHGETFDVNGSPWEPIKGFDEYWINEADAKKDPSMYYSNGLYSKVTVLDGKLIAVLAATGKNTLQDSLFRGEMLAPLQAVIHGKTDKIVWSLYSGYGALTDAGAIVYGHQIGTNTIEFVP